MNQYPPGDHVSRAQRTLRAAGPDQSLRTVEIDCGPLWGAYRITFIAKQNPRKGMRNWFWSMHRGERIEFGQPVPDSVVVDFVVGHDGSDAGTIEEPPVSTEQLKPESGMKITDLIGALERIKAEHGNLNVAEELPIGYLAIQNVEVKQIPQYRAFRAVPSPLTSLADGELVVIVKAQ